MATQLDIDEIDGICGGLGAWERIKVELYRSALREVCCLACEEAAIARLPQDERGSVTRTHVFCACGDKHCPRGASHADPCASEGQATHW